jgi:glycerol-3-phosphate dehydrogenase (NAD(P)+)
VIVAVPSHGLRAVVRAASPFIPNNAVLLARPKASRRESLQRMSEVIRTRPVARIPVVVLFGPSFAAEVAPPSADGTGRGLRKRGGRRLRAGYAFRGPSFRLYGSDDVVGVEIGAALKNIIAIRARV